MKSKVVKTVDLEQHEKDALKTIAQISCSCIDDCDYCPFYVKHYNGGEVYRRCIKDGCRAVCENVRIEWNEDYS